MTDPADLPPRDIPDDLVVTATARGVSSAILSPTRPRSVDHFEDFLDMVHRCGVFYAPPSIAATRAVSASTCPASSCTALINGAISSP